MAWVLKGRLSIASDTTTAALISTLGVSATKSAITAMLNSTVPGLVAAALASNGTVAAAAAGAAKAAVDVALDTSPRIPKLNDVPEYLSAEVTPAGKLTRGTRVDGSVEIPLARIAGALTAEQSIPEYLKATVSPSGKVLEDALGPDGRVPSWILAAWKDRMGGIADGFDIIIVAGQSNAAPSGELPFTVAEDDDRLFRWNRTTLAIEAIPASSSYLGSEFARNYIKQVRNRRVLLVEMGIGSSGFTTTSISPAPTGYTTAWPGTWDRKLTADPLNLYSRMIKETLAAKAAAGAGARYVAMLWSQGESDANARTGMPALTQAQYAALLDDLIASTRAAIGAPELPILVGSMVPEHIRDNSPATTAGIAAAHVDTPRRVLKSAFIFGPDNMVNYNNFRVHWSQQGQRERGRMFADALYRARTNQTTVSPIAPQNIRVNRSGALVELAWDFPPCRVTAFTIEYSMDGGDWLSVALAGPLVTNATLTLASRPGLRVRGRTTNEVGTSDNTKEVNA